MGLYVILMGPQGAGKGEQAKFITDTYGIPQVSTGDLFRAMNTRQDELAQRIRQILAEGKLVDDDTTNEVVRDRLGQPDAQNGVILDGYPRSPGQAAWLENYLRERGEQIAVVLLMELDFFTAFKRAFGRVRAGSSVYNIYSNSDGIEWRFVDHPEKAYPPRLEGQVTATGETLVRRDDDANAHAIIMRLDSYIRTTQPLITYYEQNGLLRRIDADQPIAVVSEAIRQAIDSSR